MCIHNANFQGMWLKTGLITSSSAWLKLNLPSLTTNLLFSSYSWVHLLVRSFNLLSKMDAWDFTASSNFLPSHTTLSLLSADFYSTCLYRHGRKGVRKQLPTPGNWPQYCTSLSGPCCYIGHQQSLRISISNKVALSPQQSTTKTKSQTTPKHTKPILSLKRVTALLYQLQLCLCSGLSSLPINHWDTHVFIDLPPLSGIIQSNWSPTS